MKRALTALLLAIAVPAAPACVAAPAGKHAPKGDADTLVTQLIAEGPLADLAAHAFDYEVDHGKDPEARALYARYPGARDAVNAALRPQMLKILRKALPDLRRQVRAILVADLTPKELHDAATFFASPTGRKVYANALKALGEKPDRSESEATAAVSAAVMRDLIPDDYGPLMRFVGSGAGRKMNRINAKIGAVSNSWSKALVARNETKMRGIAKRAADTFAAHAGRNKK